MGKLVKQLIAMLLALSLIWVTLVMGYERILFSNTYFNWHYEHREIDVETGIGIDDLMDVTYVLVDYIRGKRENLNIQVPINGNIEEVFGEREKDHMVDVRNMYLTVRLMKNIGLIFIIIILLVGIFWKKKFVYKVLKSVRFWVPIYLLIIGGLGALLTTDFDKYFTLGHELLFSNDLWLLDPRTDILIQMVPESYFYSVVVIGLIIFVVLITLVMLLINMLVKKSRWSFDI